MVGDVLALLAALRQDGQLPVEHHLELVGRHVGNTFVCLQVLQLVQAPVHALQGLNSQDTQDFGCSCI